ncbi:MAG: CxxC-x17-CxxC domain-containing protein [bacterium]
MNDFRRQNGRGGGFNAHGRDNRGPRDGAMMHKAVCSECGKSCEVPFAPNGNKPVYCNDCFGKKKGNSEKWSDGKPEFRSEGRHEHRSENRFEKRDFAPRGPIAHESRLNTEPRDGGVRELKSHMDSLNAKLDRVIKILENFSGSVVAQKPAEKFVAPQPVVVAKNNKPMSVEKAFKSFPVVKSEKPKPKAKAKVEKAKPVAKKPVVKVAAKAKPVTKKKK